MTKVDVQEKYDYWLDIAKYDLDTADAMLDSKRWLYVVFMCQQAVEKLTKGLYSKRDIDTDKEVFTDSFDVKRRIDILQELLCLTNRGRQYL
jgi:HEPN domain-containing protein